MQEILKKTRDDTFFKQFHHNSQFAKKVFKENSVFIVCQITKTDSENYLAELLRVREE